MSGIEIKVASTGDSGETVTEAHFGTNFLFHTDRVGEGTDFDNVAEAVNATFLRYPGGTVTEEYFDLTDPDATRQSHILQELEGRETVRTRNVEPLDDFLEYCKQAAIKPIIVIPTYRYFDTETREIRPEAEAEIKTFIRDVLDGAYGDVDIHSFEIGNEWYQSKFEWTTLEFGALQSQMALWIDEAIKETGIATEPDIYMQAARTAADNAELASFNTGAVADAVDGVVTHLYGTNSQGDPLGIGGGIENRLKDIAEQWAVEGQPELDLVVTEWNVGEDGIENTLINGLMRTAPLMKVFVEMIENGVDLATIWGAQTPGSAGLSTREGDGSELRPTGQLIQMLSDSIIDTHLQTTQAGENLLNEAGDHVGYNYVFEGDDKSVVYFVSGVDEDLEFSIDFSNYVSETTLVRATVLGAAAGTTGVEYDARAEIRVINDIQLVQDESGAWTYDFVLSDYEMIEFEFLSSEFVVSDEETVQEDVPDMALQGDSGQDVLYGAAGDDEIRAGRGHDQLFGDDGNDLLIGAQGKDYLDGGIGDDTLSGGNWHDTLMGGDGDDLLMPGKGRDTVDGGEGNDTVSYHELNTGVQIDLSSGTTAVQSQTDHLISVENAIGSKVDDIIIGDDGANHLSGYWGNDVIEGGAGNDSLSGGSGADRFVFKQNSGSDIVEDFDVTADIIDISHYLVDADDVQFIQHSTGTELKFADASITLWGVDVDTSNLDWLVAQ